MRMNLRKLRDTLNSIKDEHFLDEFAISRTTCTEDGRVAYGLVYGDEGDFKCLEAYSTPAFKKLKTGLINPLNRDLKVLFKAAKDDEYLDDEPDCW